jgi:regulator of replication initiation timing
MKKSLFFTLLFSLKSPAIAGDSLTENLTEAKNLEQSLSSLALETLLLGVQNLSEQHRKKIEEVNALSDQAKNIREQLELKIKEETEIKEKLDKEMAAYYDNANVVKILKMHQLLLPHKEKPEAKPLWDSLQNKIQTYQISVPASE